MSSVTPPQFIQSFGWFWFWFSARKQADVGRTVETAGRLLAVVCWRLLRYLALSTSSGAPNKAIVSQTPISSSLQLLLPDRARGTAAKAEAALALRRFLGDDGYQAGMASSPARYRVLLTPPPGRSLFRTACPST